MLQLSNKLDMLINCMEMRALAALTWIIEQRRGDQMQTLDWIGATNIFTSAWKSIVCFVATSCPNDCHINVHESILHDWDGVSYHYEPELSTI